MRVQIRCRSRVALHRLVPAFPMRITSCHGEHALTRNGFSRTLQTDRAIDIPAFESIDLQLGGSVFSASSCYLELADGNPKEIALGPSHPSAETPSWAPLLRDMISGTVFHHPQENWNAHTVAHALNTTPERIRTALFTQGMAFTHICRTQRLMRALFESIQFKLSVADLRDRVGWGSKGDLEASFYDWFGVSLQTVARLRDDGL